MTPLIYLYHECLNYMVSIQILACLALENEQYVCLVFHIFFYMALLIILFSTLLPLFNLENSLDSFPA